MEERVIKNISCYVGDEEEIWRGKILLEKDGRFKGLANDDFCASYISGSKKGENVNFSLVHCDSMDHLYSFKETGSFNQYKYYNGVWNNTIGKMVECYLTVEEINSDTMEDDIKKLEKKINDFNENKKTIQ